MPRGPAMTSPRAIAVRERARAPDLEVKRPARRGEADQPLAIVILDGAGLDEALRLERAEPAADQPLVEPAHLADARGGNLFFLGQGGKAAPFRETDPELA